MSAYPLFPSASGPAQPHGRVPTVGCIIRFKNSAETLPIVLAGLKQQTVKFERMIGIRNDSTDESTSLLLDAGFEIRDWLEPYHHSRVLNFAFGHCPTDYVLVLSSHTVLESPDAVQLMVDALQNPLAACVSGKWESDALDSFYSDSVDWNEIEAKGMRLGSIYTNSMGMIRRSCWEKIPFDESITTVEDYAWCIAQLKAGHICRRLKFSFRYLRKGGADRTYDFTQVVFLIASRHHLKVAWLGPKLTLRETFLRALECCRRHPDARTKSILQEHWGRLRAWASHQVGKLFIGRSARMRRA